MNQAGTFFGDSVNALLLSKRHGALVVLLLAFDTDDDGGGAWPRALSFCSFWDFVA